MQRQKIVITLGVEDLQEIERVVNDRDGNLAVEFVRKVIKPRVDDALDKGHCKPIFEWRHGRAEKIEPPPIKDT